MAHPPPQARSEADDLAKRLFMLTIAGVIAFAGLAFIYTNYF
jgi:hypothetical protein